MNLHWDASYAIVLELMKHYPNTNIDSIGLQQLHQMIISLPNFIDNPRTVTDSMLEDILVEWYEEVNL